MRGLLDELNEDDIWGSSLKSCGKAVSIETASLSEYARYVLRTICQQVICKTTLLSSFGETMLFYLKSITHTLLQNDCRSISVFEFCLGFLVWTIYVLNRMLLGGKKLLWLVISISLHSDRTEVFFLPESQALWEGSRTNPSAVCSKCFCSSICFIAKLVSKYREINFGKPVNSPMLRGGTEWQKTFLISCVVWTIVHFRFCVRKNHFSA